MMTYTVAVAITNVPNLCSNGSVADLANVADVPRTTKNIRSLGFSWQGNWPIAAGTYDYFNNEVAARFYATDSSCNVSVSEITDGEGMVTLTTASSTLLVGTFDFLLFGTTGSDHVTGAFSAPFRAALPFGEPAMDGSILCASF
jgi:hypothetical protein